jgi:hypothetical protein
LFSALRQTIYTYQQLIQYYYLTMVTTRSASKRMLEELAAAPMILVNERTRARARAAKPKQPKGERVRKQRSHAIAPQDDQPVSARLRSAKRNSVIEAKKQGDERLSKRLKDNETVRRSSRTRKIECLPVSDENGKHKDEPKEVCVYSKLKTTQLPAPSNEPNERKSETFSNHFLESEAFFSSDDSSEWMFEDFTDSLMITTTLHRLSTRMLTFVTTILLLTGSLNRSLILTTLINMTTFHRLSTRMLH